MNILKNILEFMLNACGVIIAVLSVMILLLIWKTTVIYEWHLQNEKAKKQNKENKDNEI